MAELVATAAEIAAVAAEHAAGSEEGRRLAAPVVDALRDAGLFRLCVPSALGGLEAHPSELVDCIEAVAHGDGAAGWCLMIGATSGAAAAHLPADGAAEVYRDPAVVTGGVFAPSGTVVAADGGVRVSGRWSWASGCQHCDWLMVGCLTDAGHRLALLPTAEVEVVDTWWAMGLRGTGSHDIAVDDRFVPAHRLADLTGAPTAGGPLYAFPVLGLLAVGVSAVGLGIARRALDELTTLAAGKVPTMASRRLAERSAVQGDVARAEALLRGGKAFLHDAIDRAWAAAAGTGEIGSADRAGLRLAATSASRWSAEAVDLVHAAAGGTAVQERASVLGRCFRDAHTVTQQLMVGPPTYDAVGRVLLGLDDGSAL
jgi:alkylation response protein AidB-like acyl-CoA dehydrogenase